MHYIVITLAVYIGFLVVFPNQVVAGTLLLVASVSNFLGKVDWTTVPW